jgi:alpha-L-fucosidase
VTNLETTTFAGRRVPEWFNQPQLGIFIHWTMATVPAFAPLTEDPFTLAEQHGWEYAIANTPYVEWYENSLAIPGSPRWLEAHHTWDAVDWARVFAASGATYVVLVTKHHDGFCLWPTDTPNPHQPNWHSQRDLVGELADAVRDAGMRFGTYYSGGLDWTYKGPITGDVITNVETMMACVPSDQDYYDYAMSHWRELIDRYRPSVLWNDIHWAYDPTPLFEYYYDVCPDGVVNDRFDLRGVHRGTAHTDFITPEYRSRPSGNMAGKKFEVCRGIGRSFGYNAQETEADYLPIPELLALRNDVLSAGGNLLLNVGPKADGTIPPEQLERLAALGDSRFHH